MQLGTQRGDSDPGVGHNERDHVLACRSKVLQARPILYQLDALSFSLQLVPLCHRSGFPPAAGISAGLGLGTGWDEASSWAGRCCDAEGAPAQGGKGLLEHPDSK